VSADITREEWLAELELVSARKSDAGLTAEQLQDLWDCCPNTARRRLRLLGRQGRLVVGRTYRRDLTGRVLPVPVYRIKK
jgi:hypothetical protein